VNIPHQTNVGLKEKCLASYNNDEHIKACRWSCNLFLLGSDFNKIWNR